MPPPIINISSRGVSVTSPDPEASSAIDIALVGLLVGAFLIVLAGYGVYTGVKWVRGKCGGKDGGRGM